MTQSGPICQSCGMPMQKDGDFGTNLDNTRNKEYCTFCFNAGKFTDEGITVEQKIEKIVKIATSHLNVPITTARTMANSIIPQLKRWKK